MKTAQKFLACLLAVSMTLGLSTGAQAASATLDEAVHQTAQLMLETVKDPQVGSVGGEWAVLGLARSGETLPDAYFQQYYTAVSDYVTACKGKLHDKKYTEFSRLIVALTAIGKDPRDVAGYDLTLALGDYEKTIWQGLNGPIWALIALDSGNYPVPVNPDAKTRATRDLYLKRILDCQLPDGGWSLQGSGSSDPDMTGMALQALAQYQDRPEVKAATDKALDLLSRQQEPDGGYSSYASSNSESVVQVLVALCALGIAPEDARFVKNGKTVLDNLMTFYTPGKGFRHTASGGGSNQMATEQALYGMVAAQRQRDGKNSLYRMSDARKTLGENASKPGKGEGLQGKHADVKPNALTEKAPQFPDIENHPDRVAIEALAARGIIAGKAGGSFDPEGSMTRAEFATIAVKALGLTAKAGTSFSDLPAGAWYVSAVETAATYQIVNGCNGAFRPLGTITRQEAAVMVANAAKLCGMDTAMDPTATRDMLAQFTDYTKAADWARPALAFCYQENLLDRSDLEIQPLATVKRCEVARMLFRLLTGANLL